MTPTVGLPRRTNLGGERGGRVEWPALLLIMKLLLQLVMDDDAKRFEKEIKELTFNGWKPYGNCLTQPTKVADAFRESGVLGIPSDKIVYFQAMVR